MIDERGPPVNDQADDLLRLGEAAEALEGLREPAERAAQAIDDAFARAGSSLARSLARAAADGEISLAELARLMLNTLNGLFSGGRATGGLEVLVATLGSGLGGILSAVFGGVSSTAGSRDGLVPSHAQPSSAVPPTAPPGIAFRKLSAPLGALAPSLERRTTIERSATRQIETGAPVTVNVSLTGPAEGLLRSEAQLAQTLARAVALGARRL
ncbi:phage tail tape measure protein [Brevundimonas lutea]|uniref:phage tail tape measure protein n=1 Tax=Brevundimonas lutea TaxID=2293980 RepID=UPI000F0345B8